MTDGSDLSDWTPLSFEPPAQLRGQYTRLERLTLDHAAPIYEANGHDPALWRFLPYGPFPSFAGYRGWAAAAAESEDPLFYAIASEWGWCGVAAYLRPALDHGVIEIGSITFSPALQRTPAATEALSLMIGHAFAAGFRRVEWKCDANNHPSRRAALRLGFRFEGTFRQHMVVKEANRDTTWFAIIDKDWPEIASAHRRWLDPRNFDDHGGQRVALSLLTDRREKAGS